MSIRGTGRFRRELHRTGGSKAPALNVKRLSVWLMVLAAFAVFHDLGFAQHSDPADPAANVGEKSSDPAHAGDADPSDHADGGDEDGHAAGHSDPVAPVLLAIVLILFLAKVGGDLFERVGMPAVLGELVVGIILGNFALLTGWDGLNFFEAPTEDRVIHDLELMLADGHGKITGHDREVLHELRQQSRELNTVVTKVEEQGFESLTAKERRVLKEASQHNPYNTGAILKMLAGIGVVLLLFEVGLESTVGEMMQVGVSSLLVAILGVIAPMGLGWAAGYFLIPDQGWQVHVFIGATLCATSVGITARVLKDLGRSQQRESQIILGAAVIDDVLGLIVLAIVAGVIQQGSVNPVGLMLVIGKAFGFLAGAVFLGTMIFTRPLFLAASILRGHGLLVAAALVICFGFSWLANFFGLAPIVGAFAAGLILERTHYAELGAKENHNLEEALQPLTALLVPIFFVQMGIQVDLASFKDPSVWGLAATITVMAIIGKQVCAFGVREKGLNTQAVGLGMIPRGEVGLIFADVGRGLQMDGVPVINDATFSAVVVMVIITTMVTPPLLKWSLSKDVGGEPPTDNSAATEAAD